MFKDGCGPFNRSMTVLTIVSQIRLCFMVGFDGLKPIVMVTTIAEEWSVQIVIIHMAGDTLWSIMGVCQWEVSRIVIKQNFCPECGLVTDGAICIKFTVSGYRRSSYFEVRIVTRITSSLFG